jgi:hypothetical protein
VRPIGCFREEPTTSSQPAHGSCNVAAVKAKPMLTLPAILFAIGPTQAAAAANINGSTTPAPLPAQEQQGARLQNATLALKALFAALTEAAFAMSAGSLRVIVRSSAAAVGKPTVSKAMPEPMQAARYNPGEWCTLVSPGIP